jgi:hypothetical protein
MTAIALPQPALPSRENLQFGAVALLVLLLVLNWSAVRTERLQRCEPRSECSCKVPSLDFSDPCNS